MLLTFQASAFDHSATSPHTSIYSSRTTAGIDSGRPGPRPAGALRASPCGRKGTGGDSGDQIYGGAELEESGAGGVGSGGGTTAGVSLAALLGGAGT
jgi:hypothetical protein